MNNWMWLLVELLAVIALAQASIWFNNARYKGANGSLRVKQILSRLRLESDGFDTVHTRGKREEYGICYVGKVDGYPVEILFEPLTGWLRHPYYTVRIGLANSSSVTPKDRGKVGKENKGWVERQVVIGKFSHPSGERLIAVAREVISDATRN